MTTWQYGLIAPTYPPKFYSQDTLIPGYTGTVSQIGIIYTVMRLDDGTTFRIPNNSWSKPRSFRTRRGNGGCG